MNKEERIAKIYQTCKEHDKVNVDFLVQITGFSPATIRRDLQTMEDSKLIRRLRGSVILHENQLVEENLASRQLLLSKEKTLIARYAASLIENQDFIYLDAGSTVSKMIPYITAKSIHIMTQSITNILELSKKDIQIYTAGGNFKTQNDIILGNETIERVKQMTFSKCFIGANGIHEFSGFTTADDLEGTLKKTVIEHSVIPIILTDSTKVHILNPMKFADLDQVTLITDYLVPDFDYSLIKEVISVTPEGIRQYRFGKQIV
ncbi:MAG: DeoR/GlpR transcriptional regulator [Erysipelotrichaceae bacterium]|nr:DeoR/GlpR transcriptional regulator [Erysipelotrichaceae bacterium]